MFVTVKAISLNVDAPAESVAIILNECVPTSLFVGFAVNQRSEIDIHEGREDPSPLVIVMVKVSPMSTSEKMTLFKGTLANGLCVDGLSSGTVKAQGDELFIVVGASFVLVTLIVKF